MSIPGVYSKDKKETSVVIKHYLVKLDDPKQLDSWLSCLICWLELVEFESLVKPSMKAF